MSTITMTNTDPGEGSALANDNFVAVYGGTSLLDIFYPVGSYYETSNTSFDPNTSWGGNWVEDSAGRVTVAKNTGTFSTVGGTGGEETHTLTVSEMPSHNHETHATRVGVGTSGNYGGNSTPVTFDEPTQYTGGDGAHNNLQPYIVVRRWHRVS